MRQLAHHTGGFGPELKAQGNAEFKKGAFHAAFDLYSEALGVETECVGILLNRSLVSLKLGDPQAGGDDAQLALEALTGQAMPDPVQLAKAYYRKGCALVALGQEGRAVAVYREGLRVCKDIGTKELQRAMLAPDGPLSIAWMTQYWGHWVEEAQAPAAMSSRDGRLLKMVPREQRLAPEQLAQHLQAALEASPQLARDSRELVLACWLQDRGPGKAALALMRSLAYLAARNLDIALKDAKVAVAYGPKGGGGGGCSWAAAWAAQGAALEGLAQNTQAALAMQRAAELMPGVEEYDEAVARLKRRIPVQHANALEANGSAALMGVLEEERIAATPEYLRERPKYYYYNNWMRERIAAHYPDLEEPIVEKLLAMDAGELDLVLEYPQATQHKVEQLKGVYEEHGAKYFEGYKVPLLTWEEVKEFKGPDTIGLGIGAEQGPMSLEAAQKAAAGRLEQGAGITTYKLLGSAGKVKAIDDGSGGGSAGSEGGTTAGSDLNATDLQNAAGKDSSGSKGMGGDIAPQVPLEEIDTDGLAASSPYRVDEVGSGFPPKPKKTVSWGSTTSRLFPKVPSSKVASSRQQIVASAQLAVDAVEAADAGGDDSDEDFVDFDDLDAVD